MKAKLRKEYIGFGGSADQVRVIPTILEISSFE
jgi:hypothetical protein